ncbi:hypothetical protein cce_2145 [Crocosphaera subtropica ATCC 51142]|uniref:Uncharacterized protein n=1 Tax=Crocosphaera subtropica (strain ATCC 51142 / BH68) TaxID=43989 RepID=B1WNR6_CROS5|nr:hypothetical protein cce_2145 [Crocosphaera subtropica ATCC 51142]
MRNIKMSQNPLDVAAMAMQHPHALEILESIRSLAEK